MILAELEKKLFEKISGIATSDDPAHDILHFQRVVKMAKYLCDKENGKFEVVIPAAWLHDMVIVQKNDPRRSQASTLSAEAAVDFLKQIQYPEQHYDEIFHAIQAHSFSANIEAKTLEAKIVQDADRLDGLGAIGIARCFATAGIMRRAFYSPEDPFCQTRVPDDSQFTVDHFFKKLFKTAETMKTPSGIKEGLKRAAVMKSYLSSLMLEVSQ